MIVFEIGETWVQDIEPKVPRMSLLEKYSITHMLQTTGSTGDIPKCVDTISSEILAYSEDSYEICYEVAHRQSNSS